MCRRDSLSQISQIANYLEKVKFQKKIILSDINIGRKTKGLEEKMGIFTLLPLSRCMFSTSVPKEKRS